MLRSLDQWGMSTGTAIVVDAVMVTVAESVAPAGSRAVKVI